MSASKFADRVRKLLAIADSPGATEGEARAAAAQAAAIIASTT